MLHTNTLPSESSVAPSLRAVNCESRRQRILDSARQLIADEGMSAVTMRRLAKTAELSVTTLYNLIGGREKIVAALVDDAIDRMDEVLAVEAPMDDPIERCRAIITVSIRHVLDHEAIFRPLALSIDDRSLDETGAERSESRPHVASRAAGMQSQAIREAISRELLINLLDPDCLGSQIYFVWEASFHEWGRGLYSASEFEARALYGLYLTLLGISTDAIRPEIESRLHELDQKIISLRLQSDAHA